jgi:hypothetical protein
MIVTQASRIPHFVQITSNTKQSPNAAANTAKTLEIKD